MEEKYNKEWCDERHENLDKATQLLFEKHEKLDACISKKFNQIIFGILMTLLSVIGSMAVIILTRSPQ